MERKQMGEQAPAQPLLELTLRITPQVYEACNLLMAQRLRKKHMSHSVVVGGVFVACAAAFLWYMLRQQQSIQPLLVACCVLLLLLGLYNLLYYPFVFLGVVKRRALGIYNRSHYFQGPVTLRFFDEYIEETTDACSSRIQWSAVRGTEQDPLFLLLRLTPSSGLIIPRDQLDPQQEETLRALLQRPLPGA